MIQDRVFGGALTVVVSFAVATPAWAQGRVTTPIEQFGHEVGADYVLFDYEELHEYFIKLTS